MIEAFVNQETIRVGKLYSVKHKTGFENRTNFKNWFIQKMRDQNFTCYYCETSIFDIRELINDGKLEKRKLGYGFRGPILEVDKKNNGEGYNPNNCVLSCYYCNNDKSYILDADNYKLFFGPARKAFFEYLKT